MLTMMAVLTRSSALLFSGRRRECEGLVVVGVLSVILIQPFSQVEEKAQKDEAKGKVGVVTMPPTSYKLIS